MKILITGGSGQVGFELQRHLCLLGYLLAPSRKELDLADASAVEACLEREQPDLIVNAAAYTAVDKAEEEPELARQLNAELPAQLAAYSAARGQWLIHYSTDYVYPGSGSRPWREGDPTDPPNTYGQSKLEGDLAVQQSGCRHLIFRTSWVYSARGHNFLRTMLRLGRERESLKVVNDQVGAPTPARLIAQVTALALHRLPLAAEPEATSPPDEADRLQGLFHLAPRGETSWHGFACEIFHQAAGLGARLALRPGAVEPIPSSAYPTPARRPLNSRLDCGALEAALGVSLPSWQEQLALTLGELLDREATGG